MQIMKHNRAALFAAFALPIGFLVIYWPTLAGLLQQWLNSEDYSHGILIIPIVAYLIWHKRGELRRVDIRPQWRALPVLIFAIFVFVVGELGAELFTIRVSMIFMVFGLVWFLCGTAALRVLLFPLCFLFLMLPLPGYFHRNLTAPLQLFSSAGSVFLLQAIGISVFREGNIIDIGVTQLQVVEACSGLRYIFPLFTIGVFLAFFERKQWWANLMLVGAAIPIAVLANVVRIAGTGIIATYWGAAAADRFFHGFSGWFVFMAGAGIYFVVYLMIRKIKTGPVASAGAPKPFAVQHIMTWPAVIIALITIVLAAPTVAHMGDVPVRPLLRPLHEFPITLNEWSGRRSQMDPALWKRVGGQDYVLIDYLDSDGAGPVNLYVAYYEHQKKGGEFIHSPRGCLPGGGWFIDENRTRRLDGPIAGQQGLKFNELLISRDGSRQLVYFWFQGRNRNFTKEYVAKFYMVWDGLWHRRTDGALVRLIVPLAAGSTVESTRLALDDFALHTFETLQEFLP
jgi:exosortase D (VPLPA-CTERM-specific)